MNADVQKSNRKAELLANTVEHVAIDQYDAVQPSANSQATSNLVRLWVLTDDKKYSDRAERTFRVLSAMLRKPAAP